MFNKELFAKNIRKARGMTSARELAKDLGLHFTTLLRMESTGTGDIDSILKVCSHFGWYVEDFIQSGLGWLVMEKRDPATYDIVLFSTEQAAMEYFSELGDQGLNISIMRVATAWMRGIKKTISE